MAFQTGMATRWSIAALAMTLNAGAVLAEETGEGWLDGPWRFGAIAYGWLPEAPATVKLDQQEVANLPEDLDTIIDGLEVAAMLEFNAHKGRLGLFLSPVYYDGKEDTNFQGVLGEERKLTVEEEVWLIDYGVGWDLGTWKLGQGADAPELTLSPFAGFRIMNLYAVIVGITVFDFRGVLRHKCRLTRAASNGYSSEQEHSKKNSRRTNVGSNRERRTNNGACLV